MELRFERRLSCSPAAAFALLTEPERMNRWSTARVRSTSSGDGGSAAGVGALRKVRTPGWPPTVLEEVVVRSEAPSAFAYRIVSPERALLRDHLGQITLAPDGAGGTRLLWRVTLEPVPFLPVRQLVTRTIEPELARSLDALERVAHGAAHAGGAPPARHEILVEEEASLADLYATARLCREEQRALADELAARSDPRHWFTRVYQHVTSLQIESCERGRYRHPGWVLRLIASFHHYYWRSLVPALGRAGGAPESHWRAAFAAMERAPRRHVRRFEQMGACVFYGMKAHIEEDLPRALARTYAAHYRGRCDYVRFRGDYFDMAHIFRDAGQRLLDELGAREVPLRWRALNAVLPREVQDAISARRYYDIPAERRRAFARGERLIELVS